MSHRPASATRIFASLLFLAGISGCARWQPETGHGLATLPPACPLKRGPVVANFGEAGMAGVYQFVTQDAPDSDIAAFLTASKTAGFDVMLITLNINGKDTLIATGHEILRTQDQTEF